MPADVFHHPQIFGEPQHFDLSPSSEAPMKPPYGLPALIFRRAYPFGDIHLSFGHHGEKALKLQAFGSRREKDAIAILRQQ